MESRPHGSERPRRRRDEHGGVHVDARIEALEVLLVGVVNDDLRDVEQGRLKLADLRFQLKVLAHPGGLSLVLESITQG
jgi:hypothetical protein